MVMRRAILLLQTTVWQRLPKFDQARLTMALLAEIAGDGYRLLEQRTSLTPLRKLWLAWRLQRREKRRYRQAATP